MTRYKVRELALRLNSCEKENTTYDKAIAAAKAIADIKEVLALFELLCGGDSNRKESELE